MHDTNTEADRHRGQPRIADDVDGSKTLLL